MAFIHHADEHVSASAASLSDGAVSVCVYCRSVFVVGLEAAPIS